MNNNIDQNRQGHLGKYYKISGKKLRKGKKLRYKEGNVSLVIKYKIRNKNTVNTYVDVVNAYLKAGSRYNLKYYGDQSKRQYYLELAKDN